VPKVFICYRREDSAYPAHHQATEVTQGQWKKVMGDNLSYEDAPNDGSAWIDTPEAPTA
jgi:hypothetical protein